MSLYWSWELEMQPQANECRQSLEAERGKEWVLPQSLQKEHNSANTLILAP